METAELDQLMLEVRKAYYRKWRAENKDKVKEHNRNYWRRQAEKQRQEIEEKEWETLAAEQAEVST